MEELATVSGRIFDASWAAEALDVWTTALEAGGAVEPLMWVEGDDVRFVFEAGGKIGPGGDAGPLLLGALGDNIDNHRIKFWFAPSRDDLDDPYPDR